MDLEEEKRRFNRIPMDGKVQLHCDGEVFDSQLHDISLKGALLRIPAGWDKSKGMVCELIFPLDSGEDAIRMRGHVAHVSDSLLGIHSESIDIDSIAHLKRLVELNLGDESELERELHELATGEE